MEWNEKNGMSSKKYNQHPIDENRRSQVAADLTFVSSHFLLIKYHELKEIDVGYISLYLFLFYERFLYICCCECFVVIKFSSQA